MTRTCKKTVLASLLAAAIGAPLSAYAADNKAMPADNHAKTADEPLSFSDRMHRRGLNDETTALKNALKVGVQSDSYRSVLKSMGYQVTAVNDADPDYLEYEIVKGRNSHELHIDRDAKTGMVKAIDVAPNLWRANSTMAALKGDSFKPMSTAEYSDRKFMQPWSNEKDMLHKALRPGQDKTFYMAKLKEMGYQVTATNEAKKDYLEYEVVKGLYSYEIQMEIADGSAKVKEVEVTSNLWQAEATEKALTANGR